MLSSIVPLSILSQSPSPKPLCGGIKKIPVFSVDACKLAKCLWSLYVWLSSIVQFSRVNKCLRFWSDLADEISVCIYSTPPAE